MCNTSEVTIKTPKHHCDFWTYFIPFSRVSSVSIVDLGQAHVCWVITFLKLLIESLELKSNPSAVFRNKNFIPDGVLRARLTLIGNFERFYHNRKKQQVKVFVEWSSKPFPSKGYKFMKKKKTKQRKVTCNYSKVIKLISKTKQNPHNLELTEHGPCQTVIN